MRLQVFESRARAQKESILPPFNEAMQGAAAAKVHLIDGERVPFIKKDRFRRRC